MLEILKITNGVTWGGLDKIFTYGIFELGYEIMDINYISIELDDQIYCLGADSVTINGETCTDSNDLINKIYS